MRTKRISSKNIFKFTKSRTEDPEGPSIGFVKEEQQSTVAAASLTSRCEGTTSWDDGKIT